MTKNFLGEARVGVRYIAILENKSINMNSIRCNSECFCIIFYNNFTHLQPSLSESGSIGALRLLTFKFNLTHTNLRHTIIPRHNIVNYFQPFNYRTLMESS